MLCIRKKICWINIGYPAQQQSVKKTQHKRYKPYVTLQQVQQGFKNNVM